MYAIAIMGNEQFENKGMLRRIEETFDDFHKAKKALLKAYKNKDLQDSLWGDKIVLIDLSIVPNDFKNYWYVHDVQFSPLTIKQN
jgi:hypothetical protein